MSSSFSLITAVSIVSIVVVATGIGYLLTYKLKDIIDYNNRRKIKKSPKIAHQSDQTLEIKELTRRFTDIREKLEYLSKNHNVSPNPKSESNGTSIMYYLADGSQRILVLGDHTTAKSFYRSPAYRTISRTYPYLGYVFDKLLCSSLGAMSGREWLNMKKPLTQFFTTRSLKDHYDTFFEKTNNWVDKLFSSSNKVTLPLQDIGLDRLTIDIIPYIIYGELSSDEIQELRELSIIHNRLMTIMGTDMLIRLPIIYNTLGSDNKKTVDTFFARWTKFNNKVIDRVNEGSNETNGCLLEAMMNHDSYKDPYALHHTLYEVALFNLDIMIDSFANLIWMVATHPEVKSKLYDECKNIDISDVNSIGSLEYLNKVVNESARLNPGIVITFSETLTESLNLNGFLLPVGTMVSLDTQAVNRDPVVWSSPHDFDPDRFDTPEKFHLHHRFGLGPRKCLGNTFGDNILKLGLVKLLQTSDIIVVEETENFADRNTIPNLSNSVMTNKITFVKR